MEVAQRALFAGDGVAERLISRSNAQGCPGKHSSIVSVSGRRVQIATRQSARNSRLCCSRSGQLKVLSLNKYLRVPHKHSNSFLSGSSSSQTGFITADSKRRNRISVVSAGLTTDSGTADESKEAELASALQKIVSDPQDIGFSTGSRTVTITVCGVLNDNDLRRLKSQVEDLDGVGNARIGTLKEGGVRGGSVAMEIDVEKRVPLPALIQSVQALDEALLILPFKSASWIWRGNKINYSVSGFGKPLILVHGFGGNAGHFARLIPFLAENHRVYAIDLLGFGASDKPSNTEYGPELWADLVCDFAKEFASEGSVLFGNSIGSLAVLASAAKAGSDLFTGIVLLNCAGAMNRKGLAQDGLALRLVAPIFIVVEYLLQQPKIANFLFNKFRSKENVKQILQQQAYCDKQAVTDQLVDILHHPSTDEGALDVFVKVFTGEPGPRPEVLMPQIDIPLLLLWGEKDPWTPANGPIAKYFRKIAVERDHVFVTTLPDVGHCPHDDRPELAAGEILPFLEKYNL
ncbi:uncharacterized protein [Physcomitrium patens]|uniref:uncharacterized protein isoform X2 n=1 Tax=Physcomitrium patens TaxID=3218 RepID=UPI000D15D929|nr:uncharacterized protein LOC112286065 isoform X2 [Physcomitrium patens]|eukprot:XP_024383373.1 uncharacterized protein LOC112286065 isoform X2 [Physcomitrella patens]